MSRCIVIVSPVDDIHALAVGHRISESTRGEVVPRLFDTPTMPRASSVTVSTEDGKVAGEFRIGPALPHGIALTIDPTAPVDLVVRVPFDEIESVWLRRPRWFGAPRRRQDEIEDHAAAATRSTFYAALSQLVVHNPIHAERDAQSKTWQLFVASRAGLRVPRSLVTAVPDDAIAFVRGLRSEGREAIYKVTLSHPEGPPTRLFEPHDLERIDTVRFAPTLFQERIDGGVDLRVAVIGEEVFAAEWRPADGVRRVVDVRLSLDNRMWPATLPDDVREPLMVAHRAFGLTVGIYDFKCDSAGRPWFLEVNPTGQWLDLETQAGYPVSSAVARLLLNTLDVPEAPTFTEDDLPVLAAGNMACTP